MREIVVCTTCRFAPDQPHGPDGRTGGQTLLVQLRKLAAGVKISEQACLWGCNRPCNVFMRDSERFCYFAGGFAPTAQSAEAILAWFALHGATVDGQVPFRTWPDAMRGHFVARVPPVKA
jgi:predicted metal-binding protein